MGNLALHVIREKRPETEERRVQPEDATPAPRISACRRAALRRRPELKSAREGISRNATPQLRNRRDRL